MKRAGFTLIEFIAMISLILVIASIAVPNYMRVVDDNRLKADTATAFEIAKISESYYAQNKSGALSKEKLKAHVLRMYDGELPIPQYDTSARFEFELDSNGRATVRMIGAEASGTGVVLVDKGKLKEISLENLMGEDE